MNTIQSVLIIGAGTMGRGIAQVMASAGLQSILYDIDQTQLHAALQAIHQQWDKAVLKGKMTTSAAALAKRCLTTSTSLTAQPVDVVIEAVVEDLKVKQTLFAAFQLPEFQHTIFASNTSSLSIADIVAPLPFKDRFIGIHFFNPASFMPLVEIVVLPTVSQALVNRVVSCLQMAGKQTVICKDAPGFIVNRVARPYYIQSLRLLETGAYSPELIDKVVTSRGFKMGPFQLMDLIGNDINYAVSCQVYTALGEPERLKPSPIQAEKVARKELGQKTGVGYYRYD